MKLRWIAGALALSLIAAPAWAEKLTFDHRLAPALKAVLDAGDPAMIAYDDHNPRFVVDVIAVRGRSASDWTEALIISSRLIDRKVGSAAAWSAEVRRDAGRRCRSDFTTLAENANSLTFERRSSGCQADFPATAIYRIVAGRRSLFMLAVSVRDELSEDARRDWLNMLASAHLE